MKSLVSLVVAVSMVLTCSMAFATASGSFTYNYGPAACTATPATWNAVTGTWDGSTLNGGYGPLTVTSTAQVPNNSTTFLITPSLDTGLFTDTKINTSNNNATADVGIMVCVDVLDANGTAQPVYPTNCLVYDQRIQQISSQLFSQLSECNTLTGANNQCNMELLLTTLSAHSFNFVSPVPVGTYTINTKWYPIGQNNNTTNGSTSWCVGPFNVTVQQVVDPSLYSAPKAVYPSIGN